MVGESAEAVAAGVGSGSSSNKMPTLEEYGTNLTKLAEEVVMIFKCCVKSMIIVQKYLATFLCFRRGNWIL